MGQWDILYVIIITWSFRGSDSVFTSDALKYDYIMRFVYNIQHCANI